MGVLRSAWVEYERDHARYFAVAMVYYALLSLVPLLLLLAALGLLLRFSAFAADAQQRVLLAVDARFGDELTAAIGPLLATLEQGPSSPPSSAWPALSSPHRCCSAICG